MPKRSDCSTAVLIEGVFLLQPDSASKITAGAMARAYYLRAGEELKAGGIEREMVMVIDRLAKRRFDVKAK